MCRVGYFNFLPKGTESNSESGPNSLAAAQEAGPRRRLERVLEGPQRPAGSEATGKGSAGLQRW